MTEQLLQQGTKEDLGSHGSVLGYTCKTDVLTSHGEWYAACRCGE